MATEQHRQNSGHETDNDNHSKPLSGPISYLRTDSNDDTPRPWRRRVPCSARFVTCYCAFCIALLSVIGVAIFVAWISIRPHKPRVFLDHASISQFSISTAGVLNTRMNFNISLRNSNEKVRIYYDNFKVDAIYNSQKMASASVSKFYQGPKNTTVIQPRVEGKSVVLDAQISRELASESESGRIRFDLKLSAKTRFKVGKWTSKSYKMRVKCDKLVVDFIAGFSRQQRCMVYF